MPEGKDGTRAVLLQAHLLSSAWRMAEFGVCLRSSLHLKQANNPEESLSRLGVPRQEGGHRAQ